MESKKEYMNGNLWNDTYIKSKDNWIFTEIGTGKVFKVEPEQTNELNLSILNELIFLNKVFKATETNSGYCKVFL
jgi:hypothetical protein